LLEFADRGDYQLLIAKHLFVLKPQNRYSRNPLQIVSSRLVIFFGIRIVVNCTVQLDGQFELGAKKINDIRTDAMLASEFQSFDLFVLEQSPQDGFGDGCVVAERYAPLFGFKAIHYDNWVCHFYQQLSTTSPVRGTGTPP
jgi:hypothetical protein